MLGQLNSQSGGNQSEITGYYTAKTINATNGSRTAIAEDLKVGHVVVLDPYGWDGETDEINVTQPQTSFLTGRKYVVTAVDRDVNKIVSSTQRKGGRVKLCPYADIIQVYCIGTTDIAIMDRLTVANGSFSLVQNTTNNTTFNLGVCAVALAAHTTDTTPTLVNCTFGAII
jgi:hypothetical protein